MDSKPRLSCEQCKRRKVRCDKEAPCAACRAAKLDCNVVQRARLPRGKTAQARNQSKLEWRVARIESLLNQRSESRESTLPLGSGRPLHACKKHHSGGLAGYIAPDFWNTLCEEVQGLRDTLEDPDDEVDEGSEATSTPPGQGWSGASSILFANHDTEEDSSLPCPSPHVGERLLQLYHYRVDNVLKILHWPTVLSGIENNRTQAINGTASLSIQALEYAIYFMAYCTVTDTESEDMRLGTRQDMAQLFRSTTENLLARSCLLHSPDLQIIQAFLIYLIGLRTCLNGAFTWTLIAVAVRAATALRLGEESEKDYSPFDLQLRRRLHFAIGILDTHAALDRGTLPMLSSTAFRKPPLCIDDRDMTPENVPTVSSSTFTEMSHTYVIYEAMVCSRRLQELSSDDRSVKSQWGEKLEVLATFEKSVADIVSRTEDSQDALQRLTKVSVQKILVSIHLLLRRPPYPQPHNEDPASDDFDVLETASRVLEQHMQPMPSDLQPWAWKNWIQWHALAVVLAELLTRPKNVSLQHHYLIANKSFRHYANIIADSQTGMLWKPIAKLMRRVQQKWHDALSKSYPHDTSLPDMLVEDFNGKVESNNVSLDLFDSSDLDNWSNNDDMYDILSYNNDSSNARLYNGLDFNILESSYDPNPFAWDMFVHDLTFPDQ